MGDEKRNQGDSGGATIEVVIPPDVVKKIRAMRAEKYDAEVELATLKNQAKAKQAELEELTDQLWRLNAELTDPRPLFAAMEAGAAKEAEAETGTPASADADPTPEFPGHTNWRTVSVLELGKFGLPAKVAEKLIEGGVGTIGDISKLGENHLSLTDVKGVGEKAAEKIEAALDAFWKAWGPGDERVADGADGRADGVASADTPSPSIPSSGLTDDQVRELAQRLEGSKADAREAAKALFGVEPSDGVVAHLHATAGVLKCQACGEWKETADFPVDETGPPPVDCFECLNADASGGE